MTAVFKRLCAGGVMLLLSACGLGVGGSSAGNSSPGASSPGITDSEVVIGYTGAITGPVAVFGKGIGYGQNAYYQYINAQGGVKMKDGKTRKIRFIPYDDAFQNAQSLQNTRQLCEQDKAFAIVGAVGQPVSADETYVNQAKCPQILIAAGQLSVGQISNYYQAPLWPPIAAEGAVYAKYISNTLKGTKVAFLKLASSVGDDFETGFKDELNRDGNSGALVATETIAATDTTAEAQMTRLAASKAGILVFVGVAGITPQVIKLSHSTGWNPQLFVYSAIAAVSVIQAAGLDQSKGLITASWLKPVTDTSDPAISLFQDNIRKYGNGLAPTDGVALQGYTHGIAMVELLKRMPQPTRESLMTTLYSLNKVQLPTVLNGITMNTSKTNHRPIQAYQLLQFDGSKYNSIGGVIDVSNLQY